MRYLSIQGFLKNSLVVKQKKEIFALPNDANGIGDKVEMREKIRAV
jgi:hypothetical protein